MKVINLLIKDSGGGAEKVVHSIEPHLRKLGVETETISCLPDFEDSAHKALTNSDRMVDRLFLAPIRLARLIKFERPDILHIHCERPEFTYALASILVPRAVRPKLCVSEHTSRPWKKNQLLGLLVRGRLRVLRANWMSCIPSPGKEFVPNPVHVDGELSPGTASLRFAYIGRLTKSKSVDTLVRAFIRLSHNSELIIIGDGPEKENLQELAKGHPRINFEGWNDSPWTVVRESDVYVTCSKFEGMPLSVLEAIHLEIPILASNIPSHRLVLPDECLFSSEDVLLKKMNECFVSKAPFKVNVAEPSIQRWFARPDEVANRWLGFYEDVMRSAN